MRSCQGQRVLKRLRKGGELEARPLKNEEEFA